LLLGPRWFEWILFITQQPHPPPIWGQPHLLLATPGHTSIKLLQTVHIEANARAAGGPETGAERMSWGAEKGSTLNKKSP